MKRKTSPHQAALTDRTTIKVRFSEIDSMQIVWHGEYVRYFEDGREAFGKRYGLDYMSIYREGYVVPIVDLYNPQIQISAESETKRSIFREKDKTKRSKKESAQHSKSRNKSFVMTSVSAL